QVQFGRQHPEAMKAMPALIVLLIAAAAMAAGHIDDPPTPTPIPFTPEPRQLQWRIGFNLGNAVILEAPELNPQNDIQQAIAEADRLLPSPQFPVSLALLQASKAIMQSQRLVNPRKWTILDLRGKTEQKAFQALGVFMGTRLTSSE